MSEIARFHFIFPQELCADSLLFVGDLSAWLEEHLIRPLSHMGNWEAWLTDHSQTSQWEGFFSHLKSWTRSALHRQVEWGSTNWPENVCFQRMSSFSNVSIKFIRIRLNWGKLVFLEMLCMSNEENLSYLPIWFQNPMELTVFLQISQLCDVELRKNSLCSNKSLH